MNGVFLVALCLSIFLDAVQRFFEPQIVYSPVLVLGVGCAGLLSNFVGLFLFHEHGHSHGADHEHSHTETNKISSAEEGQNYEISDARTRDVADEQGNVADVLPQSTIGGWPKSSRATPSVIEENLENGSQAAKRFTRSDEDASTATNSTSPISARKLATNGPRGHRRYPSSSRSAFSNVEDIQVHPASFRNDIIAAGRLTDIESAHGSDSDEGEPKETSSLLSKSRSNSTRNYMDSTTKDYRQKLHQRHDSLHKDHHHVHARESDKSGKNGHSHSDLNMRGVFLHVMGDALGNIGVIGSALIIWLTSYSWRYYVDPAISLVITLIILGSAIPLCKAASRILLQAAPENMSMDDIIGDINQLPGILSCHHLHVWQLNDTKLVASLHIQIEFDFKGEGSARYMKLAHTVRQCLIGYGIHNSTIQPEFCLDSNHQHTSRPQSDGEGQDSRKASGIGANRATSKNGSRAGSVRSEPDACLLNCSDEFDERQCCAPSSIETEVQDDAGRSHR